MNSKHPIRKIIRESYIEGAAYAVMVGTVESFVLFYVVKSGLSLKELALLSTLPVLLGSVAQWLVPMVANAQNLRRLKLWSYAAQIIGIGILIAAIWGRTEFLWLMIAMSLYWVGGMASNPLWIEWSASVVPRLCYRSFMARRNGAIALCTLVAYLSTGLLVQNKKDFATFAMVFAVGFMSRLASFGTQFFISLPERRPKVHERLLKISESKTMTSLKKEVVWMFVFTVLFRFCANLASPFFLPYMVNQLSYSLLAYIVLSAIPFLGRFVFLAGWGRASTDVKPFIGLQLCCLGIAVVPALWASYQNYFFFLSLEVFSGSFWGGFELCSILIIQRYWTGNSMRAIGLHMALMNLAALLGARVGVWLLEHGSYERTFLISSAARLTATTLMIVTFSRMPSTKQKLKVYGQYLLDVFSGHIIWRQLRDSVNPK